MAKNPTVVVPFRAVEPKHVANRVHSLAQDTSNVVWTQHAIDRLDERGITTRQVLTTLRQGRAEGLPVLDENGGWKIRLAKRSAGQPVRVVASLRQNQVYVVTVYR